MSKNWKIEPVDSQTVQLLKGTLHISELLASILVRRGITDPGEAQYFLFADRKDLLSPEEIPGLPAAVQRIEEAIKKKQRIVVYGDYDVDGVCGIVILLECLQALGSQVQHYIPDRFEEGYGLNVAAVEKLASQGTQMLITVDCGINSVEEVARANELGMEVIITDHHTPETILPEATIIVNPRLGAPEKCIDLCGAGVVFKLAQSLGSDLVSKRQLDEWIELAALATIADIVPLRGENRILVREGLASMKNTERPGLKALLRESKIIGQDLQTYHAAFIIAPRLNSAGRLKSASLAVDLLMAQDESYAYTIARELCFLNEERKRIEQAVVEEAAASVDNMDEAARQGILMVDGEFWHPGVIGIAASRLADKYSKPVVLISWEGDRGRGSARSVPGFNLYNALYSCRDSLEQFGGHAMAAGLSLNRTQVAEFRRQLLKQAQIDKPVADTTVYLEGELFSHELSIEMADELKKLEPYGEGNPVPLFLIHHDRVEQAALVGSNHSHFRAIVQPGNIPLIAFGRSEWINYPLKQCRFDLLASLEVNSYLGRENVQIKATHLIPTYRQQTTILDQPLINVLQQTIDILRSGQPAVFIFPTYRVLCYYQQLLRTLIRPDLLYPLHGHLSSEQQLTATTDLLRSQSRLFLITEPYWHYLYRLKHDLLKTPGLVVKLWSSHQSPRVSDKEKHYPERAAYPQLRLHEIMPKVSSPALFYINNTDTKMRLTGLSSASVTVSDWSFSLPDYDEYSDNHHNQPDLWLAKDNGTHAQQVVLADPPYSEYEALILASQIKTAYSPVSLKVDFDEEQLKSVRDTLQQLYPERSMIAKMAAWMSNFTTKGLIREELGTLVADITRTTGFLFNERQVLNSLRIMSDLGLCLYRKKGSIIEIKVLSTTSPTLDLADSSYYREGQAEKRAFAKWEQWVKEQMAW